MQANSGSYFRLPLAGGVSNSSIVTPRALEPLKQCYTNHVQISAEPKAKKAA